MGHSTHNHRDKTPPFVVIGRISDSVLLETLSPRRRRFRVGGRLGGVRVERRETTKEKEVEKETSGKDSETESRKRVEIEGSIKGDYGVKENSNEERSLRIQRMKSAVEFGTEVQSQRWKDDLHRFTCPTTVHLLGLV